MFTGLVESLGNVIKSEQIGSGLRLHLSAPYAGELSIGESIAVNGVCLSVISKSNASFAVEISPETVSRTMLGEIEAGAQVNLERALLPTTRLGGHFVTGHVDCVGEILSNERIGEFHRMRVQIPESYQSLIVEKGSIAIDGISLTINSIPIHSEIEIMIIPHTLKATTADLWRTGSRVHLEFDLIAKQIARMVGLYTGQRNEMQPQPAGTIIGAFE